MKNKINSQLLKLAKAVQKKAHAPYSKFEVGAALLDTSGRFFVGCNVENSSYGGTICAEQNAITTMIAQGGKYVSEILIFTNTPGGCPPCGICRQVLLEFSKDPIELKVHLANARGILSTLTLSELLPYAFDHSFLKNK